MNDVSYGQESNTLALAAHEALAAVVLRLGARGFGDTTVPDEERRLVVGPVFVWGLRLSRGRAHLLFCTPYRRIGNDVVAVLRAALWRKPSVGQSPPPHRVVVSRLVPVLLPQG